jgi:tripartite-type tricarboxylate transporter receptor subunit TctC
MRTTRFPPLLLGIVLLPPMASWGQSEAGWPIRPVRVVVGSSPGGVVDVSARLIGQRLAETLRQPIVIDNRPGAGGVVAAELVAKATPDGHTLLSISASHIIAPSLFRKLPYDTLRDFAGVALTVVVPNVLVTSPAAGARSARELVALAKSRPGQFLFSSGGVGSGVHFAAELFVNLSQIDVRHVPFKGIPEALTEVVAGRAQFTMSPASVVAPMAKDGRVIALGVTTSSRSALLPEVPTLAEAGIAGYRWDPWFGVVAPSRTPVALLERLNREIERARSRPELAPQWSALGADLLPSMTPAEIDGYLASQMNLASRLAKAAGIKPE